MSLEGEEWGGEGRGKERERETNINQSPPVCARPDRTHNLGMCPWLQSETETFWCTERHCNQLSHLAREGPIALEMNLGA